MKSSECLSQIIKTTFKDKTTLKIKKGTQLNGIVVCGEKEDAVVVPVYESCLGGATISEEDTKTIRKNLCKGCNKTSTLRIAGFVYTDRDTNKKVRVDMPIINGYCSHNCREWFEWGK